MKKFKHLSEDAVKLSVVGGGEKHRGIKDCAANVDWKMDYFKGVEVVANSNHYRLVLSNSQIIAISKNSDCQIRRVEDGFLKGCFVLVNKEKSHGAETEVYLVGDRGAMRLNLVLAKGEDLISVVDWALEKENFERVVAKEINKFSLRKGAYRAYQRVCDRLPSKCWKDKTFAANVMNEFYKCGFVDIEEDVDFKYVDFTACKQEAGEYFENYACKQVKKNVDEKTK